MKLIFQAEGKAHVSAVSTVREGARLAAHLEKNRAATGCHLEMDDHTPACDPETWNRYLAGARTLWA